MNSRIYYGYVTHSRLEPVKHTFVYPVCYYAIDLAELVEISKKVLLFGYNRFRPVSIFDKDYLNNTQGSIMNRLKKFLQDNGVDKEIKKILLVTVPRYFNYVFNPVCFYYCFQSDDSLASVVAEVNNTFGEKHLYLLDKLHPGNEKFIAESSHPKEFFVSPFNNMQGEYELRFSKLDSTLDIRVDLIKHGKKTLTTRLWGNSIPLNTINILKTFLRYPFSALLTMPRITFEAVRLHYLKKLPVVPKPNPNHRMTVRVKSPGILQRFSMSIVFQFLSGIKKGNLTLVMPDNTQRIFGDKNTSLSTIIKVHNYDFFWKIIKSGDIGFGESYTDGDWDCDDLNEVFKLFIDNMDTLNDRDLFWSKAGRLTNRFRHIRHKNTIAGSEKNIGAHYDLSNDFFSLFLDSSMLYSCAIYKNPQDTLQEAQMNKINTIIEKAQICSSDHVLEIGSGWGGFAIEAVRKTGCRVTTITISKEQYVYVQKRIKESGLQDKINVELVDYRKVSGQYDKIVSIEMLEAVGSQYYWGFFRCCDHLLKPDGRMVLHTITIPDERYDDYHRSVDWIQKYIFPGGELPCLKVLNQEIKENSSFNVIDLENIGIHYAATLRDWRNRFWDNKKDIIRLGFDEKFLRIWHYYLCYCEAGFENRILDVFHLVLTRTKKSS